MNDKPRPFDGGSLFLGTLLIGAGVLFLLDEIRIANVGDLVGTYWPLIVVALGMSKLFQLRTLWSGLWLIAIGTWLQAVNLHWYDMTYRNSWPLLLIVLGGGMVLRTFVMPFERHRRAADVDEGNHASH